MLSCAFGLAACAHDDTGDVDLNVAISALSSADVVGVRVTITGPGMTPMEADLVNVGGTYRGTIGQIPAGSDRLFTGEARNTNGDVIYRGESAPITIAPGPAALVALRLQQVMTPDPFQNGAPHIDSLFVSAQVVVPGDTVDLSATASDVDGDPLSFTWTGPGAFTTASASTTAWVAPTTEGTYALMVGVSDPKQATNAVSVTIQVSAASARGAAKVTADVNTFPQVLGLTLANSRLIEGQAAAATTQAIDADGDALSYAWSSTCGGTWSGVGAMSSLTIGSTSLTACRVRVDVTDGRGGSNFGELDVAVGPGPVAAFAPVIDSSFQSIDTASSGEQVVLRIAAHDPEATALTFSSTSTQGAMVATSTATELEVTWTAPACFLGTANIVLTATDADGQQTSHTFEVAAGAVNCVSNGLLSWWTGDSTTADAVGGRNAVAAGNGIGYGPGVHGQAFVFNGAQQLRAPSAGLPAGAANRTLEMWVRMDGATYEAWLAGYGAYGNGPLVYVVGASSGFVWVSNWGDSIHGGGGIVVPGSGWHHVAVTNVGTQFSLYADGALVASGLMNIGTYTGPGYDMLLGYADSQRRLVGALDDVRIYDRALSAAEIAWIAAGNTY